MRYDKRKYKYLKSFKNMKKEIQKYREIKINLITDEKILKDKGHSLPVIELYNYYIDTWISIKDLSFQKLLREIEHMNNTTKIILNAEYGKTTFNTK